MSCQCRDFPTELQYAAQAWLSYMKKKMTIALQMKGKSMTQRTCRYSSEPQKTHLTGEFVIVAKFSGWPCVASFSL